MEPVRERSITDTVEKDFCMGAKPFKTKPGQENGKPAAISESSFGLVHLLCKTHGYVGAVLPPGSIFDLPYPMLEQGGKG